MKRTLPVGILVFLLSGCGLLGKEEPPSTASPGPAPAAEARSCNCSSPSRLVGHYVIRHCRCGRLDCAVTYSTSKDMRVSEQPSGSGQVRMDLRTAPEDLSISCS